MRTLAATDPGAPGKLNEDWVYTSQDLIVVLDGATARTDTGCEHGVSWYASNLGAAITRLAVDQDRSLRDVLSSSIKWVADQHPGCDLDHPGTPSAAVGILRLCGERLDFLVLGDITIVIDAVSGVRTVVDDRVDGTARKERDGADRYPIGSVEKREALIRMKFVELASRNREDGYWVAATDPSAAVHALAESLNTAALRRIAVMSDGAARLVRLFKMATWGEVLDMLDESGPDSVIKGVRNAEATDPIGAAWPRNKCSDDASIVYATHLMAGR